MLSFRIFIGVLLIIKVVFTFTKPEFLQGNTLVFADRETALMELTRMAFDGLDISEIIISINGKLTGIRNFTATSDIISKRWGTENAGAAAWWFEFETPQQGPWWTDWQPSSCVHSNYNGPHPVTVTLTRSIWHRANWERGFNLDFGIQSSRDIGYETSKINAISETAWYAIPGFGYGQVWSEQMMIWQDQRSRRCTMFHNGVDGTSCGPWSSYIRGNLPVVGRVNFVLRKDWSKLDFNSCGGGS